MENCLATEHRILRYHAFSNPEEREAFIDATASSPAILSYTVDSLPNPISRFLTLFEESLTHNILIEPPTQVARNAHETTSRSQYITAGEHLHDRIGRLAAMFTLYNLARTCEGVDEGDWEEYITPYEDGELEMLECICPSEWWDEEIKDVWPNLVAFARWKREGL
jgi:hypothetical protein